MIPSRPYNCGAAVSTAGSNSRYMPYAMRQSRFPVWQFFVK